MTTNKILIKENSIEFLGFNLLKQNVTFCLYEGGIVILPDWKNETLPCHYESTLNEDREIQDEFLVTILKNRGLSNEELFVCVNNKHYVELTPHKAASN